MFSDDEGGLRTLRQPLMSAGASSDEEGGGLALLSPSSASNSRDPADSWASRRKRRRRKDEDDLGEVRPRHAGLLAGMTTVEPKLARAVGRWVLSLSLAGALGLLGAGPKAKTSPRAGASCPPLRRGDPLEDATERALKWMAGLTLALALLLVLAVAAQA